MFRSQKKYYLFALLASGEGYVYVALSQALPWLQKAFSLPNAEVGLLQSAMAFGGIMAFVFSILCDRYGNKRILLLSGMIYPLLFSAIYFVNNIIILFILLFLSALFSILFFLSLTSHVTLAAKSKKRASAIALLGLGNSLGGVMCVVLVPFFEVSHFGWRLIFLFTICFELFNFIIYYQIKDKIICHDHSFPVLFHDIAHHWRLFLKASLYWLLFYFASYSVIMFFKEYSVSSLLLSSEDISLIISLSSCLSLCAIFALSRSNVMARFHTKHVLAITAVLGFFSAWGLYSVSHIYSLIGFMSLTMLFFFYGISQLVLYCGQLFPEHLIGSGLGVSRLFFGGIGRVLSPMFVGVLASSLGWAVAIKLTLFGLLIFSVFVLREP